MTKFTKLNIGDSVASSGGRVWKKLSAESAETSNFTLSDGAIMLTSDGQIFISKEN